MTVFDTCAAFTRQCEGGYSDDPDDTGNWYGRALVGSYAGVVAADLVRLGGRFAADISAVAMENLPQDTIHAVYSGYFAAMGCDGLSGAIALMVFDAGFNTGERTAVAQLQTALGFPLFGHSLTAVDGYCGQITQGYAAIADQSVLMDKLYAAQAAHYRSLAQFDRYGRGWMVRVDARRAAALALLNGGQT